MVLHYFFGPLYLLDDIVEEAAGVLGLDLLLDPPVGGDVRDVGLVGRACTTGEDSNDTTIPSEDDRPGVASIGKLAVHLIVGQDGELYGSLFDAVLSVDAGEGIEAVGTTNGGPRRQPILHDEHAPLTVDVKVLGIADLVVLDDAVGLEETILGVLVVRSITGLREHCVGKVSDREVTTCRGKKSNTQLELKTRRREVENVTRDEEDKKRWRRDGDKDMEKDVPT
jgi:hypothetical protein